MARSLRNQPPDLELAGAELVREECSSPGLGSIPASCIEVILSLTTPKDVARMACVSRDFRDASYSDLIWQMMLPPHYTDILAQAQGAPPSNSSKKVIFDYLSNRVLLQNGTQDFWLDRATGGVCRSIGARSLGIVWGDDIRYWDWLTQEGSRFPEVAHLKQVCWFEVQGKLECYLPPGTYSLSWRVFVVGSPTRGRYYLRDGLGHSYGWSHTPVKFSLETRDGQLVNTEYYLSAEGRENRVVNGQVQQQSLRQNTWMEIDVGQFTIEAGDSSVELTFSMIEIEGGNWKSGLCLDCVVIRPTYLKLKEQIPESDRVLGTTSWLDDLTSLRTLFG